MRALLFLLMASFAMEGYAQGVVNGFNVIAVRADKTGKGYVKFDKPVAGTPAECGSNHSSHLAFDLNTPGGQGIISLALAAQASGKKVTARGTGGCGIYGTVESWSWGSVTD